MTKDRPSGRSLGERMAQAVVGALWGLAIGGLMYGALWIYKMGAVHPPVAVVWASVAWSAAFTFVFGESLGDVMTMFYRLYLLASDREYALVRDVARDERPWAESIVMFIVYVAGLLFCLHWAL